LRSIEQNNTIHCSKKKQTGKRIRYKSGIYGESFKGRLSELNCKGEDLNKTPLRRSNFRGINEEELREVRGDTSFPFWRSGRTMTGSLPLLLLP
jgi:hypothetical protein